MAEPLRIVHLEDDEADAELIRDILARDGLECVWTRINSRQQFETAIEGPCDLILAADGLADFGGTTALRLVRARRPEVPFVFVSGTMGAETAVQRVKEGAADCVLKERLERLPSAIRRALTAAEARSERQRTEAKVRRLNTELERRVEHRTAELAAANIELQRREAELRQAKSFLENLLIASPSMVFRLQPDSLRMTYVSPNIGWLLGYSAAEAVEGEGFWERIIHPLDYPRMVAVLQSALENVVAQIEEECRFCGKDGRYRWFFTLLRIEYDADARPIGVLGYALDIADRKEAEEQLQQARAFSDSILEHIPEMIFVKHASDLRYARFNRAAEDLLGINRAEVVGLTDFDLFPGEMAQGYVDKDREVLGTGRPADIGEEIIAPPGREPRVLHTKKIPIKGPDEEPLYLLGISEDITERRAAAEQLRLAKLEAERASRAKSEFLSRMSHDLRTPLNAILGFAQILELDGLSPEQSDSVQQILKGGFHLLELVNEILDIARIEAGQLSLSPEPVSVSDVVTHVVDLVRPLGTGRRIAVAAAVTDSSIHVRADRQRLKQVLLNLVGNAVKYNRDEGRVDVSCEVTSGVVRIRVADTGAGIPPEKRALLFQPFERLGAERSSVEGTGLGLAVSKGLTEAMGGEVGFHSQVDVGTTFWIALPQAEPPAPREPELRVSTAATDSTARGLVLYVEDNRSNVRLLERLLARRPSVRLLTAPSGRAALEYVRAERPDLILLDLHLPDIPGEEVLRRLWADPSTRDIPVVVLSADATVRQQERLLAAGAVAYLTKPLEVAAVLKLVDDRLSPSRSRGN